MALLKFSSLMFDVFALARIIDGSSQSAALLQAEFDPEPVEMP